MRWIFWKFPEQKRCLCGNAITFGLLRFRELNLRLKGFHSTHNGIKLIVPESSRTVRLQCARKKTANLSQPLGIHVFTENSAIFLKMINTYYHDKENELRNSARLEKSPSWESNKQYAGVVMNIDFPRWQRIIIPRRKWH